MAETAEQCGWDYNAHLERWQKFGSGCVIHGGDRWEVHFPNTDWAVAKSFAHAARLADEYDNRNLGADTQAGKAMKPTDPDDLNDPRQ